MISLYDYLGRAAGTKLGAQVAEYAKLKNAQFSTREISNPQYTGKVMLYNKEFLDEFFRVRDIFELKQKSTIEEFVDFLGEDKEEDLPF